ncbi:MAG: M42 family peptidase [Clostridia bacterium]|nr:M42 family peptidase [Clostridia bacterium]
MMQLLEKLCNLCGAAGREDKVRDFILSEIEGYADIKVDNLGNIIADKKGKKRAKIKVVADAHMDEVGIIVTHIDEGGFVKFATCGGIEIPALLGKRFVFEKGAVGVVCSKPTHLCDAAEKKVLPKLDSLCIDVGAKDKKEAEEMVCVGETAVFVPNFEKIGNLICAKALDDRVGCTVLIKLLKEEAEYDFTAVFSVQEELGLRGAKVAAFSTNPDAAIIVEGTTAADVPESSGANRVCHVGDGAVLSFMDRSTMYDKKLYDDGRRLADQNGIKCQTKSVVAGGNNAGAYHIARGGIRTAAVSLPCRYIHSSSSVASPSDAENVYRLVKLLIEKLAGGEI